MMRPETIAEQLFFTTARIQAESEAGSSVGTGFVYAVETDQGTGHFLVTNKHVLHGAKAITVNMVRAAGDFPALGQATRITLGEFSADGWHGHPDPNVDVALLPLAPVFNAMAEGGAAPFFRALSPELMASQELLETLDALQEVTFIGYPSGLFDTANFLPIARRGVTATPVTVDYQGVPVFLIDAAVFPGSSGSPVFLLDRGMYHARDGGAVVGSRFACLGILAAVHIRTVGGIVEQIPSVLGVRIQEPIGLGLVFRALTIDECVDALLERLGIRRIEPPPSAAPGDVNTDANVTLAESMPPTDT